MNSEKRQAGIGALLANGLTVSRIFFAGLFLVFFCDQDFFPSWGDPERFAASVVALVLFLTALLTDLLDGRIARRFGEITTFGQFVDPIADKVLVSACLIAFVGHGDTSYVKAWTVTVIIAREFLVTGIRLLAAAEGRVIAAERLGKLKTGWQMGYILFVLATVAIKRGSRVFQSDWMAMFGACLEAMAKLGVYVVVVMTLISGGYYVWKNIHLLKIGSAD